MVAYDSVPPNSVPKNVTKVGNAATSGGRENVFNQRIIQSANQAAADLNNVVSLPTYRFQRVCSAATKQGPGLLDATKTVIGKSGYPDRTLMQLYKAMATGFQRNLAAIEASGLMPSGMLTDQMDSGDAEGRRHQSHQTVSSWHRCGRLSKTAWMW